MTGLYPDAPGMMIQYDRDGEALYSDGGGWITMTAAQKASLNKTPAVIAYTTSVWGTANLGIILAEAHDIVGVSNNTYGSGNGSIIFETSVDTTNVVDGTWVSRGAFSSLGYRTPTAVSYAGIRGFRWGFANGSLDKAKLQGVHLYGQPSDAALTANPNRLRMWHPTLDQVLNGPALDFGDIQRLTSPTKTFRVKNNSATQTANSVVISSESLNDATPTIVGVQTFDVAGGGYAATQNIGNLAAGAISGLITLKTAPGSTAELSIWRQRVKAIAGSWA